LNSVAVKFEPLLHEFNEFDSIMFSARVEDEKERAARRQENKL
jgi:hypothetical protein